MTGDPSQFAPGAVRVGDYSRDVSSTARAEIGFKVTTTYTSHRINHFEYRIAVAVSAIGNQISAS